MAGFCLFGKAGRNGPRERVEPFGCWALKVERGMFTFAAMRPFLPSAFMPASLVAADFPAPESLPSRPELPDPLVMLDGSRIATKEEWLTKRAPELRALFQHYMYGKRPQPARPVEG